MESEKRINWLSLFIKVVIIFIFVLIIIWLLSKLIGRNKLSETFTNNINNMEKVSVEYFKTVDLPLEKGQSISVTLGELIEKELIISENSDSENSCDIEKSYSKITRKKDKYIVETTLICGKEDDTIQIDFSLENCKNCNQSTENGSSSNEEKNESANSDNSDTNSNTTSSNTTTKVTYYEHVKETTTYTKWMRGSQTGNNIENRYEYYGIDYDTYYTLGVIPSDKTTTTYTIKLNSVPNSKYYFTTIEESEDFTATDEVNYIKKINTSIYNGNSTNTPTKDMEKYTLQDSNITYKLSPYYRKGTFYITVTITVNNTDGVETYYDSKLQKNAYLVPLKIKVKFASNVISETKPVGEYDTISYYRYVTVNKETIWSTETYVEGYTKTGNTKFE